MSFDFRFGDGENNFCPVMNIQWSSDA